MSAHTPTADDLRGSATDRLRQLTPPRRFYPVLATAALFVGMLGAGGIRYEGFTSPQVILNLLVDNAFLIVLAVGMTCVILTGGIDLSVGSVVALSTMVAASTLRAGWPAALVVVAVLLSGSVLGLLMGLVIHYFEIQPFIVTLAGMFLARGLCYLISIESIPIKDPTFTSFAMGTIDLPGGYFITPAVLVALFVLAVAAWGLHMTRFGRTVYAVGGSEQSALLMGLAVARTKVGVYVISGFCSSLAGLLFSVYMLSGYSLHAVGMELDAIAAVVIGGTLLAGGSGLVLGSALGVLVLGTIQTFISFDGNLSSWWTKITIGVLLLVFVVIQRLFTRRQA
ncbi:galactofuranose ABC transporter, permease protein YjfF [Aeromicrobium chenweiae]|uniref:Sugar ABC transporter permease YjfF n=1 Tax=Aeromicrobium chenweiae TaxID=2079793 RepID=A0A2S0WQY1_9ACTN|nr:galactofuranose ABC transporter, permease protein YjfF [Aeromicrobium chenweiae]AWB93668.1 sugar ABC transporter permease YjfF [Aeromicrobium chenweiae]TGN30484.1 sugar ABC transporter permease YjfF [Aeromicrobium chenweiae]